MNEVPNTLRPEEHVLSTLNSDGSRRRIRPRLASGRFLTRRRIVAYSLIALFVLLPYLKVGGKPMVLLDLAHREFHFFGATFLPTDSVLLMLLGLSIVIAVFLLTALFGRVWCGWACPQTVYLEFLYRPIERFFEGTPAQQAKIDRQGGLNLRRIAKYVTFLVLSMFVAHVFLAYFVSVDTLFEWVQSSPVDHPASFIIMASVTGLMFFDFAWFREQTCILACPYGRLQSVMIDRKSLIVGYDAERGEPRGKHKKKKLPMAGTAVQKGDCIDCGACVQVCPTGIDIRDGLQMECVTCTQCIDACDGIMDKIHKPRGLIRYSSQDELAGQKRKLIRARIIVYPAILLLVVGLFGYFVTHKPAADITVLRTNSPFSLFDDGRVSNQVLLRVTNRAEAPRSYTVTLEGADDAEFIAPMNPFTLKARQTKTVTFIINSDRSQYEHGKRAIGLHLVDGAALDTVIHHELLGPVTQGTP